MIYKIVYALLIALIVLLTIGAFFTLKKDKDDNDELNVAFDLIAITLGIGALVVNFALTPLFL